MPFAIHLLPVSPTLILYASVSVALGAVLWMVFVDRAFARNRRGQQHPLGWRNGGKPRS